jgi:hypothetical protein
MMAEAIRNDYQSDHHKWGESLPFIVLISQTRVLGADHGFRNAQVYERGRRDG